MDIKLNYLDSLLETGIKKDWIPIINNDFEYSNLYASFIKDEKITKWQEEYKGYNIYYEIKGKGMLKAIHIEIMKKPNLNKALKSQTRTGMLNLLDSITELMKIILLIRR